MPGWLQSSGGPLTADQVAILVKGIKQQQWDSAAGAKMQKVYPSAPPLIATGAAGNAQAGEKVYAAACAACHGENGEGEEGIAGAINNQTFLELCSDVEIRRYIITGRPDLGMPNFADNQDRGADFKTLNRTTSHRSRRFPHPMARKEIFRITNRQKLTTWQNTTHRSTGSGSPTAPHVPHVAHRASVASSPRSL